MWIPETSLRLMRCASRLNKQIIGRPRLIASLTLALSERRKSLLNQITFTDTLQNLAVLILMSVNVGLHLQQTQGEFTFIGLGKN